MKRNDEDNSGDLVRGQDAVNLSPPKDFSGWRRCSQLKVLPRTLVAGEDAVNSKSSQGL